MKELRLRFTAVAADDILHQAAWYEEQSGQRLAKRWEAAVTLALLRVIANPRLGARCRFAEKSLRDVRRVPVGRFPNHLIFYRVLKEHILVLRILHGAQDLENML